MYDRRVVRGNTYAAMIIPVSTIISFIAWSNYKIKAIIKIAIKNQKIIFYSSFLI